MLRLLPFLLLLACASSPDTYQRGAYRPVAPNPTFNPSQDAPHRTGQPVHNRPRPVVPLSPHTRVLPQTPETRQHPGLWSGDRPKAAAPWDETEPIIIGTVIPIPPTTGPITALIPGQIRKCAYLANSLFDMKMSPEDLVGAPSEVRACLAALAFRHCARSDVDALDRLIAQGKAPMERTEAAIRGTLIHAEQVVARTCNKEREQSQWLARWFAVFTKEWPRFNTWSTP